MSGNGQAFPSSETFPASLRWALRHMRHRLNLTTTGKNRRQLAADPA
jgi:hypothetical protein